MGQGFAFGSGGRSITFLPTHCLKCLPLKSATSWAANTAPIPEEPPFLEENIIKESKTLALGEILIYINIRVLGQKRGSGLQNLLIPTPSQGKGQGCLVLFPSGTPGPGEKVLME